MARVTVVSRRRAPSRRGSLPGYRYALPELRSRREAGGVTLVALADELGIPRPTLSRIENLELRASPERQEVIASALKLPIDAVFAPEEERQLESRDQAISAGFAGGSSTAVLAARYGLSRSRVRTILEAHGLERPRGHSIETADAIVARYEQGVSGAQVARELEIPQSTVFYLLDQRGVKRRRTGRPRIHPPSSPRPCPTCGEVFTPAADTLARGDGRFCSRDCAWGSEETRQKWSDGATAQHRRAAEELAALCERNDLLTVRDAASELMVAGNTITGRYIPAGLLPAAKVEVQGLSFWVMKPSDLQSFRRAWMAADGPQREARMRWLDADRVVAVWRGHGWLAKLSRTKNLSLEDAEAIIRDRVRRRREKYRKQGGRPPKIALKARLLEGLAKACALDWASELTEAELLSQVALFDFDLSPEDWDYSPEKRANRQTAIERVRHHIGVEVTKALQTLQAKPV